MQSGLARAATSTIDGDKTPELLALLAASGIELLSALLHASFSLAAGMLSNAAFALYALGAKKLLATRDAQSTYALLTMLSCTLLTPVALAMEWSKAGAAQLASGSMSR